LEELKGIGVEINELGFKLLSSESFKTSETRRSLVTVELTVRQLGYLHGARILELYGRATSLGLSLCPVVLGPFLRCQYLDQPEGFWGQPSSAHRSPPGSVTIASAPLTSDDVFQKDFICGGSRACYGCVAINPVPSTSGMPRIISSFVSRDMRILPNQSPEPTPIGAFGRLVTSVTRRVSGSGWFSFLR
jgi:hypothetical protein